MEIEILEEKKNPLIDRTEVKFKVDHFEEGTPNRLEVRKKIAALQGGELSLSIIKKIKSHFGRFHSIGLACIYDNMEELQFYEPFHIKVRNLPPEKRNEIYAAKRKKQPYQHLIEL